MIIKNTLLFENIRHDNYSMYTHLVSNDDYGEHNHNFIEIFYITSGTIAHTYNGVKENLTIGDMFFILPDATHSFIRPSDCTHRDIIFDYDFFCDICNSIDKDILHQLKDLQVKKIKLSNHNILFLENLLTEYNCYIHGNASKSRTIAFLVASFMVNILLTIMQDQSNNPLPTWFAKILDRFQSANYVKEGLSAILKDIPYNHIYINRVFKKYYGKNISSYLLDLRLNYSAIALKTTNKTVDTIISDYGFSSPTLFFKAFKKKYGMTPNYYRKTQSKNLNDVTE